MHLQRCRQPNQTESDRTSHSPIKLRTIKPVQIMHLPPCRKMNCIGSNCTCNAYILPSKNDQACPIALSTMQTHESNRKRLHLQLSHQRTIKRVQMHLQPCRRMNRIGSGRTCNSPFKEWSSRFKCTFNLADEWIRSDCNGPYASNNHPDKKAHAWGMCVKLCGYFFLIGPPDLICMWFGEDQRANIIKH